MIVVLGGISLIWRPVMQVLRPDTLLALCRCTDTAQCESSPDLHKLLDEYQVELIIAAGWRHLIPKYVLDDVTVVGFHHAKLPEYPGRAPVPWTLLRGDKEAYATLLYLTEEPDAGDIIAEAALRIRPPDITARELYRQLGDISAELLAEHLPGILDGTAPRKPQDRSRRGPLTTADGWQRLGQSL